MLTRLNALHNWLNKLTQNSSFHLTPIAGDASFRRYFRLHYDTSSFIVMDAPPDKEKLSPFISIARTLSENGVRAPEILAFDLEQGFALLEDFGDALLLDDIESERTEGHYRSAINTLQSMQTCPTDTPNLPTFDAAFMHQEIQLFCVWFLEQWLGITPSHAEDHMLGNIFTYLVDTILNQPTCFIHSDYHSRNLALIGPIQAPMIGVLDFQDAMIGPFTYDLVSLLKDSYVKTPDITCLARLNYFYEHMPRQQATWSRDAFEHAFHLMGLQRHLKVLGIFCRLHARDGKSQYLSDLPLTFSYLVDALTIEEELLPFKQFIDERVYPAFKYKMQTL